MISFVALRYNVTTLVTAFNIPEKLSNDLRIFKLINNVKVDYDTLSLCRISSSKVLE